MPQTRKRTSELSESGRFFSFVEGREDLEACSIWTGPKAGRYGAFNFGGKMTYAHRWVWSYIYGDIPEGRVIDHLCGNPLCVNPFHLRTTTQRENLLAGKTTVNAKNAAKDRCAHGHYFSPANTYYWRGSRKCRTCHRENARRYRETNS